VKGAVNGVATIYPSNHLEMSGTTLTKYFYAGSQRIAIRAGASDPQWILGDHLSSATTIADATERLTKNTNNIGNGKDYDRE